MKKFYFRKKNRIYFFLIIGSIFLSIMALICLLYCVLSMQNEYISDSKDKIFLVLGGIVYVSASLYFLVMLFEKVKIYNRMYTISNGKIEFKGNANFENVVYGYGLKLNKQQAQCITISNINYCFITIFSFKNYSITTEKEKKGKKQVIMGYMFLMDKFVYDIERCESSWDFYRLNKRNDYKSQFYETSCSMYYQEEVLDELYLNGFNGEIFILKAIYDTRKQSFDKIFVKNNVPKEKIHIEA